LQQRLLCEIKKAAIFDMAELGGPTKHGQGRAPGEARHNLSKLVIKVAQLGLPLALAGILGGVAYLFSRWHSQRPASVLMSTPPPSPAPLALSPPAILGSPTAPLVSSAPPASLPLSSDRFVDGMQRILQAGDSGFRELRGKLIKTENATGSYPLFRFRKIYEGTILFGDANSAQIEEVYYSRADQPAYNYQLYFQESPDKDSKLRDLRQRLDKMLPDFVHTSGTGFDAWAGSDSKRTAVLLNDRDVPGFIEVQVHVAFSTPRW
jgi:hypothetical protein